MVVLLHDLQLLYAALYHQQCQAMTTAISIMDTRLISPTLTLSTTTTLSDSVNLSLVAMSVPAPAMQYYHCVAGTLKRVVWYFEEGCMVL